MEILLISGDSLSGNSSTVSFKRTIVNELIKNHNVTLVQYNYTGFSALKKITKNKKLTIYEGSYKYYFIDRLNYKLYRVFNKKLFRKKDWNMIYPEFFIRDIVNKVQGDYDYIISIFAPHYAHRIAYDLIKEGNVKIGGWKQLWFETWNDINNFTSKSKGLITDESRFLSEATTIYYSSELLLEDHGFIFPNHNDKMELFDLPAYPIKTEKTKCEYEVGYFGSYDSNVRNIIPLYQALKDGEIPSIIIGNSDLNLVNTKYVDVIDKRISEENVFKYESNSGILVILCNWFADLIPGKLYKYASYDKPILVILDGSYRIKNFLIEKLGNYEKFYFAENNKKDILSQLNQIQKSYKEIDVSPITSFSPEQIVNKILE